MKNLHNVKQEFPPDRISLASLVLLLMAVFLLPPHGARAQSSPPSFQTLSISLWPEYDRSDVLVMYRGELDMATELPAQLTFRMPGYIQSMHAVATRQDDTLFNVDPASIEWTREGDDAWLSFPSSSLGIHFEYYDPVILTKQGQTRQITYTLFVPYDIGTTIFEIQHPIQSEDVIIVPEPMNVYVSGDGLTYSTLQASNLAAGDTFELFITYRRGASELSASSFDSVPPEQPGDVSAPTTFGGGNPWTYALYAVAGAGVVFLIFFWRETSLRSRLRAEYQREPPPSSRKQARRGKRGSGKSKSGRGASASRGASAPPPRTAKTEQAALFCYQCGTALRENASFCHDCGAPRRGM